MLCEKLLFDFPIQLVATVLGVVLGIWASKKQEREKEQSDRVSICNELIEELTKNLVELRRIQTTQVDIRSTAVVLLNTHFLEISSERRLFLFNGKLNLCLNDLLYELQMVNRKLDLLVEFALRMTEDGMRTRRYELVKPATITALNDCVTKCQQALDEVKDYKSKLPVT